MVGELTAVLAVGDALTHCPTGERLTVLAHSADELVLGDLWPAAYHVPEHRHPRMSEHWQLLSGRASFSIAGIEHVVAARQEMMAGADVAHSARVLGADPAYVRMTFDQRSAGWMSSSASSAATILASSPKAIRMSLPSDEAAPRASRVGWPQNSAPLSGRDGSTPSARTGAFLTR